MSSSDPLSAFRKWYSELRGLKQYGGRPAKGTIAAALIVLERLRDTCQLSLEAHVTKGGAQIAGLNLASLRKILKRSGETRDFPSEGGRTNRGNDRPIRNLLESLAESSFDELPEAARETRISEMQEELVASLDAYYRLERVRFEYDPRITVQHIVARILTSAENRSQSGPVSQHLVGAKLAIRFPQLQIGNSSFSAADDQAGRTGDFEVGGTAFHVTVAPNLGHARRCEKNIRDGLACYLLVPNSKLQRARVLVEEVGAGDEVAVEAIESFVGQNLGEIGEFAPQQVLRAFADLLRFYNERVQAVETDHSLLIEVPLSLA